MRGLEERSEAVSLAVAIADYAAAFEVNSDSAIAMARHCLTDALGRGFEALRDPDCACLIGPLVPGAMMPGGARVPGTSLELDPPQAAFCLGVMFCPTAGSNLDPELPALHQAAGPLAASLATADYRARKATMEGAAPPRMRDVLVATVKAVEIQGVLALRGGHDPAGTAALRIPRLAVTAMVAAALGGTRVQIVNALVCAGIGDPVSVGADETSVSGSGGWATADTISRAVRHGCQAVISGRALPLTAIEPSAAAGHPFGTTMIDTLVVRHNRQHSESLRTRFRAAVDRHFPLRQAERIKALFAAPERLDDLPVNELLAALVVNGASGARGCQ
jgi:2-methylcitrate dehydratase